MEKNIEKLRKEWPSIKESVIEEIKNVYLSWIKAYQKNFNKNLGLPKDIPFNYFIERVRELTDKPKTEFNRKTFKK